MKKTKLGILVIVFCIILSFFSFSCADSAMYFEVDETNTTSVIENVSQYTTTVLAKGSYVSPNNGGITFTSTSTGVCSVEVVGLNHKDLDGKDLYYTITNSKGKEVRLAAYYNPETKKYETFSNGNNRNSTKVDFVAIAGETYTIALSDTKGAAHTGYWNRPLLTSARPDEEMEYQVTISVNTEASNKEYFQSNLSTAKISESSTLTLEENLEEVVLENKIPEDEAPEFDGYGVGDVLGDAVEGGKNLVSEYIVNPFEEVICETMLAIGDFFVNLMNSIIGEEVTITALVYNQVDAVNPNFFDKAVSGKGITANIKAAVSKWYEIFSLVAIAVYITVLLAIGVQILLASTSSGMAKAKKLLMQWFKGIICLVFIPYIIKYAFLINEEIVALLSQNGAAPDYSVSNTFGNSTEWSAEEIEFRSPEFVSNYTGKVAFGSDEATESYMKKLTKYEQSLDLMRIMRAYAGVTKKFIYAVIWWILIGQLIAFIVQYYKRYFMISFLIAMFPLVCIFNGISIARGTGTAEIGSWMKELFTNIFMQMIQAIIYTIITSVCVSIVKADIQSSATLNWLLIILAINFVSEGEKILRKILGAMGSTSGAVGQTGQGIKGAFNRAKQNFNSIRHGMD